MLSSMEPQELIEKIKLLLRIGSLKLRILLTLSHGVNRVAIE
jgi:hypothetical protein